MGLFGSLFSGAADDGAKSVAQLIDQLESDDRHVWVPAVEALVAKGKKAIPPLIEALERDHGAHAVLVLAKIGAETIPHLLQALSGPGAANASCALDELGAPAVPAIVKAIRGDDANTRIYGLLTLKKMKAKARSALPGLRAMRAKADDEIRTLLEETISEIAKASGESSEPDEAPVAATEKIRFACQECNKKLFVASALAGKKIKCPHCQARTIAPMR